MELPGDEIEGLILGPGSFFLGVNPLKIV